jgi:hypothetical protein
MAFKITKDEAKRIEALADDLGERRETIDNTIDEINAFIADKVGDVNILISYYNEKLQEARGVIEDIHAERQGEFDDKSEKWQDGERGDATREWLESLDSMKDNDLADIAEFEIDECEIKLDDEVEDHRVILTENLNHEPSY